MGAEHSTHVNLVTVSGVGPRFEATCSCGWDSGLWHGSGAKAQAFTAAHQDRERLKARDAGGSR